MKWETAEPLGTQQVIDEPSGLGKPLAAVAAAAFNLGVTRMFHELLAATAKLGTRLRD
jgi:hypothetical protein